MKSENNIQDLKFSNFKDLEPAVYAALETYCNVHRGAGHFSRVTTHLFEMARTVVLEYLRLDESRYVVIFSNRNRERRLRKLLKPDSFHVLSSKDIGLAIGVVAIAVKRNSLPKEAPFETGGGTAKLISKDWIIWSSAPHKFEAGTPAIMNVITFAKALTLIGTTDGRDPKKLESSTSSATGLLYDDSLKGLSGRELFLEIKKLHIGGDIQVPTASGLSRFVNLDNSASTPSFLPIWDVYRKTLQLSEKQQASVIHEVKSICAKTLKASAEKYDIVFTTNTTEAINIVADSMGKDDESESQTVIVNSILEHSSNELPWRMLSHGSMLRLSADEEGFINLPQLEDLLIAYNDKRLHGKKKIKLVSITGASNVLGTCNDLAEISKVCHKYGANLLVDAAQLVAHRAIDMETLGIDFLAFSAHKVYAPFGSGALIARKGLLNFTPKELQNISMSGEENVAGIAALGKALHTLNTIGMALIETEEKKLSQYLLKGLSEVPGINIYGFDNSDNEEINNKVGVVVFAFKKIMADKIAKGLRDTGGIGIRSGCHCAHIIVKHILNVGPGLERFQRVIQTVFPKIELPGVARVSIGIENTKEDVQVFLDTLMKIATGNKSKLRNEINSFVSERSKMVYGK